MNQEMLSRALAAHQEKPLDVFYGYLCGRTVYRGYIEALRMAGIPTLNMTLDDKTHRYSVLEPTGWAGMVDVASAFDLCWTSDPTAASWYMNHGARVIYQPAGANPDVFVPRECVRDIPVLFIGKNYGSRAQIIRTLSDDHGIDVACYGEGWPSGPVSVEQMVDLMNRAQITLGIGEVGYGIISLKGRDFEAPMCGACYLTQYNEELETHYTIGEHLVTWTSVADLVGRIQYLLAKPQEAERIRHNAAIHARAHHTWKARFEAAFRAMGVMA